MNRKLAKILPITALKLGPTQFQTEVERLRAEGKFPSLKDVLGAVAEIRLEYRPRILAARNRSNNQPPFSEEDQ